MTTELITAVIAAAVSIIFGIVSFTVNKKGISSSIVPKERLNWNENVRLELQKFISEYTLDDPRKNELMRLKFNIEIYLDDSIDEGIQKYLKNALTDAMDNYMLENKQKYIDDIAHGAQILFTVMFRLIKLESFLSYNEQKHNENKIIKHAIEVEEYRRKQNNFVENKE